MVTMTTKTTMMKMIFKNFFYNGDVLNMSNSETVLDFFFNYFWPKD